MSADSSTRNAGPRPAALQPRERARRARVEDRDAHVGGNLVEPIAQRAVRIAVVAEQQALLVGVPRVVDEDLGPPGAARRAPRVDDALLSRSSASTMSRSAAASARSVGRADAAELDEHAREALGVGDRVSRAADDPACRAGAEFGADAQRAPRPEPAGRPESRRAATTTRTVGTQSLAGPLSGARRRIATARGGGAARRGGAHRRRPRPSRRLDHGRDRERRVAGHEIEPLPPRRVVQLVRLVEERGARRTSSGAARSPSDGRCSVTPPRPSIERITP